jgi:hypothetical protein
METIMKTNQQTNTTTTTEEVTTTSPAPQFDHLAFIKECGSKSAAIRKLAVTKSRGEIAKMLQIRYQHVRNVLITPIKNERKPIQ